MIAAPIAPETVTRTALSNGLIVLAQEQPGTGQVTVHASVRAGGMFDGDRGGLARFTAALLQRGTPRQASQEIAETLESLGASLSIFSNIETVTAQLRMLREDARTVVGTLAEVLMQPVFAPGEVVKVRGELLTGLRIAGQDTRYVAERAFRSLVYPAGHPQARMIDGDEASVERLHRDDLLAFHRERYRPEATILAVVGDLAAGDVMELSAQLFAAWERAGVWRLPHLPPVARSLAPRHAEVRLPGKIQSDIVLGGPGVARDDPHYYETMMANLILGQLGMMGRLGDSVRERQGMAYYAYSDLRAGLLAGPWWVRAGVNPQNEARAIDSIRAEVRAFRSSGPTDEELNDARNFLIGSLAVRLETAAGIAQTLADMELFGLGLDYIVRYPRIIGALTREGITDAARRFPEDADGVAIAGPPPAA